MEKRKEWRRSRIKKPICITSSFIAVPDEKVPLITDLIKKMKKEHPRAGMKAFVFPREEECI